MKNRTSLVLGLAGGLVVLLTLGLLFVAWSTIPDDETGVKAFAAVLGLVGVLVTTGGTILGLAIKHSIDVRTMALNRETERRQNLEAAIGAVQLLTDDKGTAPALPEQAGGALIALSSLGNHDLAVALLEQLWRPESGRLDSSSALSVIGAVLELEDSTAVSERLKIRATHALRSNPGGMISEPAGMLRLPRPLTYTWPKHLPQEARENALVALLSAAELAARDTKDGPWQDMDDFLVNVLNDVLLLLVRVSRQQWEAEHVRGTASRSILYLEKCWPADYEMSTEDGTQSVSDIFAYARRVEGETETQLTLVTPIAERTASRLDSYMHESKEDDT